MSTPSWVTESLLPGTAYLVAAYAFAVVMLGGYLGWLLRRLNTLSGAAHRKR